MSGVGGVNGPSGINPIDPVNKVGLGAVPSESQMVSHYQALMGIIWMMDGDAEANNAKSLTSADASGLLPFALFSALQACLNDLLPWGSSKPTNPIELDIFNLEVTLFQPGGLLDAQAMSSAANMMTALYSVPPTVEGKPNKEQLFQVVANNVYYFYSQHLEGDPSFALQYAGSNPSAFPSTTQTAQFPGYPLFSTSSTDPNDLNGGLIPWGIMGNSNNPTTKGAPVTNIPGWGPTPVGAYSDTTGISPYCVWASTFMRALDKLQDQVNDGTTISTGQAEAFSTIVNNLEKSISAMGTPMYQTASILNVLLAAPMGSHPSLATLAKDCSGSGNAQPQLQAMADALNGSLFQTDKSAPNGWEGRSTATNINYVIYGQINNPGTSGNNMDDLPPNYPPREKDGQYPYYQNRLYNWETKANPNPPPT